MLENAVYHAPPTVPAFDGRPSTLDAILLHQIALDCTNLQ